eukprot:TRINITY_DN15001_c5_g1_i1.p1 TRINITY_DN15001_c5_g1~~TRINITY_DN15001_c5_g1_i1.p1  ORF type:complete len:150 (-),score=48.24 TRINITY_DN15001_c5_g1_i1:341-790(-)
MAFAIRRGSMALASRSVLAAAAPASRTAWSSHGPALALFSERYCRSFSTASDTQGRVIEAVKRFVALRKDELSKQVDDTSGDKAKMAQALETEITETTTWDELGFDDLDKVEVLLEVEEEFKHTIPDDDADRISSVSETTEYVTKNVKE